MTLLELLQLLRKKLALVIILPLLAAGATAAFSWLYLTDDYTSDVSLYVLTKASDDSASTVTSSDTTASQQLANDIAVLAESNRVLKTTASELGMTSLDDYNIAVTSSTTNRVITLSVTGKKPEAVAIIADELAVQTADTAVDVMDLRAVNIVEAAEIPEQPSGPNRPAYTAIALLAGLMLAVFIVVLLDLFNTKIKTPEETEGLLGLPVLGKMPRLKKKEL